LVALTTAQGASFTAKGTEHIIDIKEIGEDFVRIWVYSEPIEIILRIGKRANVDVDGGGWADVRIELRGIKNNNAFLYVKELKGPSKFSIPIPTGEQVSVEEQFDLPEITLLPRGLMSGKAWLEVLHDFEKLVRTNVDYWIGQAKTKKSWLLPSLAFTAILLLFFLRSFSFYLQKKRLKEKPKQ